MTRDPSEDEKVGSDNESGGFEHVDLNSAPADPDAGLNEEERAKIDARLIRRLDWKLIPWLCFLYLISFLDRTNIGNAKIYGLQDDLNMTNSQYNICLTIFFVSYSIFEPLTNVLLKRLRPSIFIPIIMLLWGIVMTFMGVVTNFAGLAATRWFLGLTEAGLFPGVNYYLSCWYKRSEFGIRAAIFFSFAAIAGSFGGLLAAGIAQMDGIGGRPGWAWIFIFEGIGTVIVGVLSFWLVHDFPTEAKFLSSEDRARVLRRLAQDKQASAKNEAFDKRYIWQSLGDWKTYLYSIIYIGCLGPLYAFSLFLPTIINELGYSSTRANLLSVPPYACGAILTIVVGYAADRTGRRGIYNIGVVLMAIVGFVMLIASTAPGVQYAGTFLGALGIYPCIANTISWASNNIEGVYKRGVSLGIIIGLGNLNGVVSSNIYRSQDAPRFFLGHGVVLGYLVCLLFGGSVSMFLSLKLENSKRIKGDRNGWVAGKTDEEIERIGDKRPNFIYTL